MRGGRPDSLTCVLRVHMGRVVAEVDEEGDRHSELEPLHHVGLTVEGVGHVASQDDDVARARRHKLGLVLHSAGGTWGEGIGVSWSKSLGFVAHTHS